MSTANVASHCRVVLPPSELDKAPSDLADRRSYWLARIARNASQFSRWGLQKSLAFCRDAYGDHDLWADPTFCARAEALVQRACLGNA